MHKVFRRNVSAVFPYGAVACFRAHRPDVSASDLLRLLPTAEGARLAGNQLLLLGANLLVLGGIAWLLLRLWNKEEKRIEQ